MEFGEQYVSYESKNNFGVAENYAWNLTGYSETRYGNPYYYLTTYRNTAMIQASHSKAESTDDERMVLVNTIYYLCQRTQNQFAY